MKFDSKRRLYNCFERELVYLSVEMSEAGQDIKTREAGASCEEEGPLGGEMQTILARMQTVLARQDILARDTAMGSISGGVFVWNLFPIYAPHGDCPVG